MMRAHLLLLVLPFAAACGDDDRTPTGPTGQSSRTPPTPSFFVSSATSVTGNLGGLAGADMTCQRLAAAIGQGARAWRAYLSVERDPANGNRPTHARDRIGTGPWYNVNLRLIANNLTELHSRPGDAELFVDERGQRINGQWTGSPSPVEHDVLTGSNADGTAAAGLTCADWTADSADVVAQVGHSDGMGPNQSTAGTLSSWNSAHPNQNCSNTAPRGGAGRLYCFAPSAPKRLSVARDEGDEGPDDAPWNLRALTKDGGQVGGGRCNGRPTRTTSRVEGRAVAAVHHFTEGAPVIAQDRQPYLNTRHDNPFQFFGAPTVMRSTGETTDGHFCLLEQLCPPGLASPYHVHHNEDEAFYVLEGDRGLPLR